MSRRDASPPCRKAKQLEDASKLAPPSWPAKSRSGAVDARGAGRRQQQRVPDNTFLERFSEQDGQIYLTGLSSDAAGLVAKLQASPLLRSPALSGSVQPDAAAHRDRFTLAAELASTPMGDAKATGGAHAPAPR